MISLALSRAVERTVPALPEALDRPISEVAGTLAYLAAPRARAAVRSNLEIVAGRPSGARRAFVAQARHYLETFRILNLTPDRLLAMVDIEGWAHLAQAHARGKGVILASAHLGPVVLCGQILTARGLDVSVLVETKSGEMGRLVDRARSAMGIKTIDTRSAMAIARALVRGAVVGVLGDRAVTGVGERVTFFGREALLPSGHVALALRTGAALVPAFASREGARLVARIEPELVLARTGDRDTDVRDGVRRWAAVLERVIARAPEQWSVFEPVWDR
ncbi:MAG: lysophospholipid acyltransferase family protein [Chloroflexi bacterium]|nr:lysophospholipid acyltransferase family protein [Chloroflexota bacterium]MBI2983616.1 lysophospholipid acyltransferase family protein [Chloroflexota bacterium]